MARGDMLVTIGNVGGAVEILNRKEFEAVSMTVDFTGVSTTDADGNKYVPAGTPVSKAGAPIKTTPWTGAVGILLHNVYEDRPQGAALTKAYIHKTRAQANSSLTYDADLVTALNAAGCRIRFEEPLM